MLRDDRQVRFPALRRGFGATASKTLINISTGAPVSGGSSGAVITPIAKPPIDAPVQFFPTNKAPDTNPYATWISDERRIPGLPVTPSVQPPLTQPVTAPPASPPVYDLGPGWTYTPGQGTTRTLPGGTSSSGSALSPIKAAVVESAGGKVPPATPGGPTMNVDVTAGTPGATSPESRAAIAAAQKGEVNMAGMGSAVVWLGLGVAGLLYVFFKKGR